MSSQANAKVLAYMYQVDDLGGAAVFASHDGRFVDAVPGPVDQSATLTVRRHGNYLVFVSAESYLVGERVTPTWTVSVE